MRLLFKSQELANRFKRGEVNAFLDEKERMPGEQVIFKERRKYGRRNRVVIGQGEISRTSSVVLFFIEKEFDPLGIEINLDGRRLSSEEVVVLAERCGILPYGLRLKYLSKSVRRWAGFLHYVKNINYCQ